jgi:hypothetical protein
MLDSSNLETGNLVLNVIMVVPPENLELLVQKPSVFSMCTETKNYNYKTKYYSGYMYIN